MIVIVIGIVIAMVTMMRKFGASIWFLQWLGQKLLQSMEWRKQPDLLVGFRG